MYTLSRHIGSRDIPPAIRPSVCVKNKRYPKPKGSLRLNIGGRFVAKKGHWREPCEGPLRVEDGQTRRRKALGQRKLNSRTERGHALDHAGDFGIGDPKIAMAPLCLGSQQAAVNELRQVRAGRLRRDARLIRQLTAGRADPSINVHTILVRATSARSLATRGISGVSSVGHQRVCNVVIIRNVRRNPAVSNCREQ